MKTKLLFTILLAVVVLLLVWSGTTHAQPFDNHQSLQPLTISNTVYLPIVSKPPCQWIEYPKLYSSINKPVAKIGEVVTVTGVLVNDCSVVGHPLYWMTTSSSAISLTLSYWFGYPIGIPPGSAQAVTLTALAVSPGEVEINLYVEYETANPLDPTPGFHYDYISAKPITMRVIP